MWVPRLAIIGENIAEKTAPQGELERCSRRGRVSMGEHAFTGRDSRRDQPAQVDEDVPVSHECQRSTAVLRWAIYRRPGSGTILQ